MDVSDMLKYVSAAAVIFAVDDGAALPKLQSSTLHQFLGNAHRVFARVAVACPRTGFRMAKYMGSQEATSQSR